MKILKEEMYRGRRGEAKTEPQGTVTVKGSNMNDDSAKETAWSDRKEENQEKSVSQKPRAKRVSKCSINYCRKVKKNLFNLEMNKSLATLEKVMRREA